MYYMHIAYFDLWMSRGFKVDTLVFIVHFLNDKCIPCHVIIKNFETSNTSKSAMALQVNDVFTKHALNACVFVYVKDEGNNFSSMTFALTFFLSCEVLELLTPFVGAYWGHAMSKCCQYPTNDSKLCELG